MDTTNHAVREYLLDLQRRIVAALEAEDGGAFITDHWRREPGGKLEGEGLSRLIEAGQLGPMLRCRRRQRLALHVREAAARAFEHAAAFDQARQALSFQLAARLAMPVVGDERAAVLGLERRDDAALQLEQVVANGLVRRAHSVAPVRLSA